MNPSNQELVFKGMRRFRFRQDAALLQAQQAQPSTEAGKAFAEAGLQAE